MRFATLRVFVFLTGIPVWFLAGCAPPPPPMMSPYLSAKPIEVCAAGQCGAAGEMFALEDIAKATAEMLKANSPGVWDFCESDPNTRRCSRSYLSYTVRGPISVEGRVPQGALRRGVRYDGKRTVHAPINIPTHALGTVAVCDDARSSFDVRSANVFLWHSHVYRCSMMGGPKNIIAEGRYGIDFVDFDRGIMGGEFAIRVSGGGNGYQVGYAVTRFATGMQAARSVWLKPRSATPPPMAVVTPVPAYVPAPPPVAVPVAAPAQLAPGLLGDYHALVIGNNRYRHLRPLKSAVSDAKSVAGLLENRYGFKTRILLNADRNAMLGALEHYRKSLTPRDNLLIYYAGHGWLDAESDEGFWLPVNAEEGSQIQWISNATVTGMLRAMRAKHVMVVADSCYSGKLSRGLHLNPRSPDYLQRIAQKRTRVVMSSGGLEPVLDSGGGTDHSVFTGAFLKVLGENPAIVEGTRLFSQIRRKVMLAADQIPEYADIRKAGHDGGDFLFAPR